MPVKMTVSCDACSETILDHKYHRMFTPDQLRTLYLCRRCYAVVCRLIEARARTGEWPPT